jgi:IclR family acetate operon transcriptional repressor
LLEIRDSFDETVNLVEMHGWNARYVDQVESLRPVRMFNQIGNEVPLHSSAAGKSMIAVQPKRVRQAFLARAPFERMTESTIVGADAMRTEIERVESRGYALDLQERDEGVICVAAAIRDPTVGAC